MFWAMVVLTGVATGLFGDFLMWILFGVQHLAFNYHSGELQTAAEHASTLRGCSPCDWRGHRRCGLVPRSPLPADEKAEIDDAVWSGDGNLGFRRSLVTSGISES